MAHIQEIDEKKFRIFEEVLNDIVNANDDGSSQDKWEELTSRLSSQGNDDIEEIASWFE